MDMIESRNLTIHTYNVRLADEVADVIPHYYKLIHDIIQRTLPMKIDNKKS